MLIAFKSTTFPHVKHAYIANVEYYYPFSLLLDFIFFLKTMEDVQTQNVRSFLLIHSLVAIVNAYIPCCICICHAKTKLNKRIVGCAEQFCMDGCLECTSCQLDNDDDDHCPSCVVNANRICTLHPIRCVVCQSDICASCQEDCTACGNVICWSCSKSNKYRNAFCIQCDEPVCSKNCYRQCSFCGVRLCHVCISNCEQCNMPACIKVCINSHNCDMNTASKKRARAE